MLDFTRLNDRQIVKELANLWGHENPQRTKADMDLETNSSTWCMKLTFRYHHWYIRVDFTRHHTMHVQLYVVEQPMANQPGRLIVKTTLPGDDPLWVDGDVSLFQRCAPILCSAHDETANIQACLAVINRIRSHLRLKLDTPEYSQELRELMDRQRL